MTDIEFMNFLYTQTVKGIIKWKYNEGSNCLVTVTISKYDYYDVVLNDVSLYVSSTAFNKFIILDENLLKIKDNIFSFVNRNCISNHENDIYNDVVSSIINNGTIS